MSIKKQQLLFIILLVMLIIMGILGFVVYNKTTPQKAPTPTIQTPTTPLSATVAPTTDPKALDNVLHHNKTQKCTVVDANGTTQTYYMSGQTVRAEFAPTNTKQKVELLADGELAYIWIDSKTKGSSVDELDTKTINAVMQQYGLSGFDINAKMDLQCEQWKANPAVLAAPYTVVFTPVTK